MLGKKQTGIDHIRVVWYNFKESCFLNKSIQVWLTAIATPFAYGTIGLA